jgi:hypothetical protein
MKTLARMTLVGCIALCGSGAALASGNCGMNSNKPCPPPDKLISKEPAYKSMNSNKPTARRADDAAAPTDVQASEGEETAARATLTGVSASDLKMKPKPPPCNLNSNTPCADEGKAPAVADVDSGEGTATPAKATLSGVNPSDLKLKPKPTKSQRKEPVE